MHTRHRDHVTGSALAWMFIDIYPYRVKRALGAVRSAITHNPWKPAVFISYMGI